MINETVLITQIDFLFFVTHYLLLILNHPLLTWGDGSKSLITAKLVMPIDKVSSEINNSPGILPIYLTVRPNLPGIIRL
jgi:hypothetical protein